MNLRNCSIFGVPCTAFNSFACRDVANFVEILWDHFLEVTFYAFLSGRGEISVICQDVRLLKEKFDERLPLSKSLTSSQTSCILASSSSSLKSMTPEQGEQLTETAMNTELAPSLVQAEYSAAETAAHDDEALINDEWEIFDNPTLL